MVWIQPAHEDSVKQYCKSRQLEDMKENILYSPEVKRRIGA